MWNLQHSNCNKPAWSSSRKRSAPLDGAITVEWDASAKTGIAILENLSYLRTVNRAKTPPGGDIISKQCEQGSTEISADARRENRSGGVKLNANESRHQSWLLRPWRRMFLITPLNSENK